MKSCRACGREIGRIPSFALELLGLTALPDWLDTLCANCLYDLSNEVEQDDQGVIANPITMDGLNTFLVDTMQMFVRRLSSNRPIEWCEVITGGMFIGDPADMPCKRFAAYQLDGHWVCGPHGLAMKRGKELAFVGCRQHARRPFLIWARSGDELVQRAREMAIVANTEIMP
jgi:hypothetical protein